MKALAAAIDRRAALVWALLLGVLALAFLVGLRSPPLAVALVAVFGLLAVFVLLLSTERGALYVACAVLLVATVLPSDLSYTLRIPLAGGGIFISDMLLGALAAAWIASLLVRRWVTVTRSAVSLPLALFLGWALVAALLGYVGGNQFKYILQDLRSLGYFIIFFWVITAVQDRRGVRLVLLTLAACIPLAFMDGLIYTALGKAVATGYTEAGVARFPAPNDVFMMGSVMLGSWVVLWPSGRKRPTILWVLLGVCLVGVLISLIRGYYVGLAVAVVYLFLVLRTAQKARLVAGIVVAVVLLSLGLLMVKPALFLSIVSRAVAVTAVNDRNVQYRFLENQGALVQIKQKPVQGNGLGKEYYPDFTRYGVPIQPEIYLHNNYLWILQRMGAVGLLLFVWWVLAFLLPRGGLRATPMDGDPLLGGLVIGSRALLASLLVVSITSPQFSAFADVAPIAAIMGIAEVSRRLLSEPAEGPEAEPVQAPAGAPAGGSGDDGGP